MSKEVKRLIALASLVFVIIATLVGLLLNWMGKFSFICPDLDLCDKEEVLIEPQH